MVSTFFTLSEWCCSTCAWTKGIRARGSGPPAAEVRENGSLTAHIRLKRSPYPFTHTHIYTPTHPYLHAAWLLGLRPLTLKPPVGGVAVVQPGPGRGVGVKGGHDDARVARARHHLFVACAGDRVSAVHAQSRGSYWAYLEGQGVALVRTLETRGWLTRGEGGARVAAGTFHTSTLVLGGEAGGNVMLTG